MSGLMGGLGRRGLVLGLTAMLIGAGAIAADDGRARVVLAAQKTQKKKTAAKKTDAAPAPATKPVPATTPPAEGALSFKSDIAPILVANCFGCHSGNGQGVRRSKLDMTTFDKLMAGGKRGKDIVGGDPEGSTLVRMIKGEETPKMPPNNGQRGFADEAAAKIEDWVKQGAKLDAGVASTEPIAKYAATLDDLKRSELAKLSPEERDKVAEQAGRERWKKASKVEPEITTAKGGHFLLLSNLPKERANKLLAAMEGPVQAGQPSCSRRPGRRCSTRSRRSASTSSRTTSRSSSSSAGSRAAEVEAGEQARAKLTVDSPYLVAVDPAGGGEEAAPPPKKGGRGKKKAEATAAGPDRTLAGILTEQLAAGATLKAGKPPRWISLGLGAFMASHLEPRAAPITGPSAARPPSRSGSAGRPRPTARSAARRRPRPSRPSASPSSSGCRPTSRARPSRPSSRSMLEGQGKTDDAIGQCFEGSRQEFLDHSGLWISERYGQPAIDRGRRRRPPADRYFIPSGGGTHRKLFPGVEIHATAGEGLMLSLVDLAAGSVVPEHSHPHEQMGMLISGRPSSPSAA